MEHVEADRLDIALGLAIRVRRHSKGMSQSDLGDAIGVSFQQIQKYERGSNRVSFSTLVRVCEALGCSVPDLISDMERLGGIARGGDPLVQPEAAPVLEALSEIRSAQVRQAIVVFARAMARETA
jgi:transcriptional regulator with XRE-family HTH domain